MKGRITINMRHTGRIYIGLDFEHYGTLMTLVKAFNLISGDAEFHQSRKRLVEAIDSFNSRIKKQVATSQ